MTYLRTDQYTNIEPDCPVTTYLHRPDDAVEVTLGEHRASETTLRLVLDDTDACHRIAEAFRNAGCQLAAHHAKDEHPDPALSQPDSQRPAPVAV